MQWLCGGCSGFVLVVLRLCVGCVVVVLPSCYRRVTVVLRLCYGCVPVVYNPAVCPSELCVVDCGAHGVCLSGSCHCEEGWAGPECLQRDCHPRCIDHGVCREGKCDCHQGWTGEHCTIGRSSHQGLDSPHTPRTPGAGQSSDPEHQGG